MAEKRRKSARALRDRKRLLARYYHTHGHGENGTVFADKKEEKFIRFRIVFAFCAIIILSVGLFFVIF